MPPFGVVPMEFLLCAGTGQHSLAVVLHESSEFAQLSQLLAELRHDGPQDYRIDLYSTSGTSLMLADQRLTPIAFVRSVPLDVQTLLILDGDWPLEPFSVAWLARAARYAPRVVALGAGVELLAASGLLDGVRARVAEGAAAALALRYPAVRFEEGRGLRCDGRFWSQAGGQRFIELLRRLRLEDEQARLGGLLLGGVEEGEDDLVLRSLRWWLRHLQQGPDMAQTADAMHVSERTLRRRFVEVLGLSPHRMFSLIRLQLAREALGESHLPIDKIARHLGLLDGQQLTRLFRRYAGSTPGDYRQRLALCEADAGLPAWLELLIEQERWQRPWRTR